MAAAGYRIGELAARLGLTERTIRYYEEMGLLGSVRRAEGGRRVYTDDDVQRLRFIQRLKVLGLSLQEMHELERLYRQDGSNRKMLPRLIQLLDAHIDATEDRITSLEALRDEIRSYREHVARRLLEEGI
ncbi:MAG: MerR family transcriptional regulator [Chloroflexota bacterium]|nr:MerR family transcriptional regulator [Chloroflexota bacterium]